MADLELRDYLEAARLASDRARTVTVVLVVASVINLIGMLNALDHAWMERRLLQSATPASDYVSGLIGPPPVLHSGETDKEFAHAREIYESHYHELYAAFTKAFVDSGFGVRVPLFGVTIDTNDLGAFGGFALLVILFMFDYSTRREHQNLKVAFECAMVEGALPMFYDLLAMHQLLTVPLREAGRKRELSAALPKLICLLPLIVQAVEVATDLQSNPTGNALDPLHNTILVCVETFCFLLMMPLSYWTLRRLYDVDRTWDTWAKVRFGM